MLLIAARATSHAVSSGPTLVLLGVIYILFIAFNLCSDVDDATAIISRKHNPGRNLSVKKSNSAGECECYQETEVFSFPHKIDFWRARNAIEVSNTSENWRHHRYIMPRVTISSLIIATIIVATTMGAVTAQGLRNKNLKVNPCLVKHICNSGFQVEPIASSGDYKCKCTSSALRSCNTRPSQCSRGFVPPADLPSFSFEYRCFKLGISCPWSAIRARMCSRKYQKIMFFFLASYFDHTMP